MALTYRSDWAQPAETGWWKNEFPALFSYEQRPSSIGQTEYAPWAKGLSYAPVSGMTYKLMEDRWNRWVEDTHPELFQFSTDMYGGYGGAVGMVGSSPSFPNFTPDQDQEIQAAAQAYGVPPNFLKAIINRESSGDWASNNRYWYGRPQSGPLLPYIGVFEDAARSRGFGALWEQAFGNRAVQTQLLAGVLRSQYDQLKKQNPNYGWQNVASYHFSGRPEPIGWADENGLTDTQYVNAFMREWRALDAAAGNMPGGFDPGPIAGPGGAMTQIEAIWGGGAKEADISQGLERSYFSMYEHPDWYAYGRQHGLDGVTHTGIDYGMPEGTRLYSPVAGTVTIAGGSGYYTYDHNPSAPMTGELRIQMDNGAEVILGHMANIYVPVGTRLNPGDYVGLSGFGGTGDHLHLEVRVPDPSVPSGTRIIDPHDFFTGAFSGTFQQGQVGAGVSRPMTFNDFMRAGAMGKPIRGGLVLSSGSGWHDWVRQAMAGNVQSWDMRPSADPWAPYSTGPFIGPTP